MDILRGVIRGVQSDRITFIAASLSYYAFISLIPLLLLALVVANVAGGEAFEQAVIDLAEANLGGDTGKTVTDAVTGEEGQAGASAVALVTLTWSSLKLFRGMDVGFSIAYRSPLPEGIVGQVKRGFITLLAVGGGIVFTVAVGTVIALARFDIVVGSVSVIGLLGTLALLLGLTVTFLPLYYFLPNADITVREALPGAAFAAVGWTALQTGFRLYTELSTGYEAYGVLAGALLLLTFLYFGGLIVLTGVVLNAVLAGRVDTDEDFDASHSTDTTRSLMADDTTTTSLGEQSDDRDRSAEMAEDDLEAEVRRLRREVRSFEERIEERTVHRDELESDLRKYVRQRVRRGKARGWGPYLVLLYGTAMTLGAFYFLQESAWAAVLAMLVIWLSTLGLYVVFVVLGFTFGALGLPGKLLDRVRSFRS
ncbi:YihY/virulence factor BrkB family protein [Halomarina rubra]|uniref:YihY/virulence factor BrkB family protein n=1 Tax=Halomarina rubra TaxID=2071873 RepID=A0ABD6AU17_9EURY